MADPQQDIRPIPDPTVLTTAASVRLEEMIRNLISTEITHQTVLFDQKLAEIRTQLRMLEGRTAEQKKDTKDALDAALAAQKEQAASQTTSLERNIGKSELATSERIKTIEALLSTFTRVSDDKIGDLKTRIVAIEAIKLGNVEQATGIRGNMASIMSIVMAVIAVASIIIAIIVVLKP
jgi:hypothetical protein